MKKLLAAISASYLYLSSATTAFAQIVVTPPAGKGFKTVGDFFTNFLFLAFAVAILVVLVMLIWGAFEWITSGGDKEAVGKARGRIINALIGLAVLAIAFALTRVAAQFLGFNIQDIVIPTPNPNPPAEQF